MDCRVKPGNDSFEHTWRNVLRLLRPTDYTPSIRFDVGIADHLAPLLGVIDNELAELGGRGCIELQAQIDEPRLELGAGKRLVHQLVEDGDDLRRRVRRRADPLPAARLVARHSPIVGTSGNTAMRLVVVTPARSWAALI